MQALTAYPRIDRFMRTSKVIDIDKSQEIQNQQKLEYENDIKMFKSNLLKYQEAASKTYLSKNTMGDSENFYSHALFCYYPQLVDRIWKDHEMGVGMFNLQGMERRNKESKNAAKRFCNGKFNVCVQTMRRKFDFFYFSA